MKIAFYGRAEVHVRQSEGSFEHYVVDAVDRNMYHLIYVLQERLATVQPHRDVCLEVGEVSTRTIVEVWPIEADNTADPLDQIFSKWQAEIERRRRRKQARKVPDASLDLNREKEAGESTNGKDGEG